MPLTALAGDMFALLDTLGSAGVALSESVRRARTQCAGEVSVAVGVDAVELAGPAWRAIEREGGATTPFQTHALAMELADAHERRGETVRVVVVHDGGRPVVVLPTVVTRWSGVTALRFLGDPLIQYGDALAAAGVPMRHLQTAWDAAADPAVAKLVYFRKVREDARIAPLLAKQATLLAVHDAPFVETAGAPVANARDARELRRLRRRLQDTGETRLDILHGHDARVAAAEALSIKRAWLDARGIDSSVIGDDAWESALLALAGRPASSLRVARLSVGGATAAVEIGLVHGDRWCAFLGAVAPDFARAGPGNVQMDDTIAYCREAGIATYDLLAPADPYKSRLAHGSAAVRDYAAALTASGWPGLLTARSIPTIKSLAARMPAALRRAVMAVRPD